MRSRIDSRYTKAPPLWEGLLLSRATRGQDCKLALAEATRLVLQSQPAVMNKLVPATTCRYLGGYRPSNRSMSAPVSRQLLDQPPDKDQARGSKSKRKGCENKKTDVIAKHFNVSGGSFNHWGTSGPILLVRRRTLRRCRTTHGEFRSAQGRVQCKTWDG